MDNLIFPRSQELSLVNAMVDGADYVGAKLHLFKNDINPNADTILADFEECDFDGYAAATVTWSNAFFDTDDIALSSGGEILFTQDDAIGNNVYGGYLTNTAGDKLLWSGRLPDAPYPMAESGDVLPVVLKVGLLRGLLQESPTP